MPRALFRPGEAFTVKGVLIDAETGQPLSGIRVYWEQYETATGVWKPTADTTTGSDGSYEFRITAPPEEGTFRYRCRSEATPEYAGDVSPSISITVKKPKAARTTLSITLA